MKVIKTSAYKQAFAQFNISQLKEMGFEFIVDDDPSGDFLITVIKDKIDVAEALFTQTGNLASNEMSIVDVSTAPAYRRLGIATAMYQIAEQESGKTIVRTPDRTPDSDKLWEQPGRPFGKQE